MSDTRTIKAPKAVFSGIPATLPQTVVTIPYDGSTTGNGAMTISAYKVGNFIFGISANVVFQMPCYSTGGGNTPWATETPNSGRFGAQTSPKINETAEFIAAAFGCTLNTAFSTANVELRNIASGGSIASSTGGDIFFDNTTAMSGTLKPINQFNTLPADPFIIDGILINNAPHDSLVAMNAVVSGVGDSGAAFAKLTGTTYTDFFYKNDGNPTFVACNVNNLTDTAIVQIAASLGITPTSAVFATNIGGRQVLESAGAWTFTTGGPATSYILVSLTV